MIWRRCATWLLVFAAWAGLAAWQYSEYHRARRMAFDELRREAKTVSQALIGGIRTHRGMGWFFEENLQQAIDDVVASDMVVAAAIETVDGTRLAYAGEVTLLDAVDELPREGGALAFRDTFELQPMGRGDRSSPDLGGRGHGPGRLRLRADTGELGSVFHTVVLLDAQSTEGRCRKEAWLRGIVVLAGSLVMLCVVLAWSMTLRAAAARGRARLLESEAGHLRDLSQAAAGLAHETRNPLAVIRGWTQRLCDELPPEMEQCQKALIIVEECDRVTARINQFLSFARPSAPRFEPFNADTVIDELVSLMEPILEARKLRLDRNDSCAPCTIRADREMFRQAIFNLLQNAVQFSEDDSVIDISIRRSTNGKRRVEVADRGCGVQDDAVDSLFTPYFTTRHDGTGLGLAIVRRIATIHNWQAGYTKRPERGSIFWLDHIDG